MLRFLFTPLLAILFFLIGLCLGVIYGPKIRLTQAGQFLVSLSYNVPLNKSVAKTGTNSPIELYDYPTIKWRAKPLAEPEGAIGQLWTSYEATDQQHQSGKMNYRLTLFKAGDKRQCLVQLLDDQGFKITQFDVSDFHPVPGAPEIVESRDSHPCTEAEYRRLGDYSVD